MNTQPEFHIHVDAEWLHPAAEHELRALGFWSMEFRDRTRHPSHYAPQRHLTVKLDDVRVFKAQFPHVVAAVTGQMQGYIEGEYVANKRTISCEERWQSIMFPFRFTTGALPPGRFREDEIHLTFRDGPIDSQLEVALLAAGFAYAELDKSDGLAQVFTVQGTRRDIGRILGPTLHFLEHCGGYRSVRVKEERIARWWASTPDMVFPPTLASIEETP